MQLAKDFYESPRTSSEFMDVTMPFTFDTFNYCTHNCLYCFSYIMRCCNPCAKIDENGHMQDIKGINSEKFKRIFNGKFPNNSVYRAFIKRRFVLHWGGLSDPFCHLEKKFGIGYDVIKYLADTNYPTIFSTKGDLPIQGKYFDIFKNESVRKNKNFMFQLSITIPNNELSKKIEMGTPGTDERIEVIRKLSNLGYWVCLRLSPFIIGASDVGLEDLIKKCADAGAKEISTRFMCLQINATKPKIKARWDRLSELLGYDVVDYFKETSPTERGTYLRSNRELKARYFKPLALYAKKYNLELHSYDPDFRDFHIPAKGNDTLEKYNPSLHQRSKFALSYHLKNLRKAYWKSGGKNQYLKWSDIIKSEPYNWMHEYNYFHESLSCFYVDISKKNITVETEYHDAWNNLRSVKNPYNYYYGKLLPVGLDENRDVIYKYVPSEYEINWIKEGVTEY